MKNKKYFSILFLIIMLMNSFMPIISSAKDNLEKEVFNDLRRVPQNIDSSVTQGAVIIYGMAEDGSLTKQLTDNNGVWKPEIPAEIQINNILKFEVKWSISDILNKGLVAGDWFEFALPSEYFNFTNAGPIKLMAKNETTGIDEEIGEYFINAKTDTEVAKIKVVLNETAVKKSFINDGFLNVTGKAGKVKEKDFQISVGGIVLPEIEIKPINPEEEFDPKGPVDKDGWQQGETNRIDWGIYINYDNMQEVFNGTSAEAVQRNNLILIDEFPKGIILGDNIHIDLAIPLYVATEDGRMTKTIIPPSTGVGGWNNYSVIGNPLFTQITQDTGETWDAFQTRVKNSNALSYGVYKDSGDNRYKFIMNFGNFPGDLKSPKNLEKIYEVINNTDLSNEKKDATKAAYKRISDATNGTMALGFLLQIQKTEVADEFLDTEKFINEAKITWTEGTDGDEWDASFQKPGGGAVTGDPQSVTIKKLEDGTDKKLEGAKFKLQKKNSEGIFVDFTPLDEGEIERPTDLNGEVVFKKLPNGEYKVVETNPPLGYTDEITFLNGKDTFTIDGTEKGTIFITAYNKLNKIDIEGEKTWDDHNNQDGKRPSSIEINLYKTVNDITEAVKDENGNYIKITVSPDTNGDWKYKFKDLPKYDNGVEIKYSVKEKKVIGYIPEYSENNINIVNKYEPLKTAFHVTKSWDDNNNSEGIRPKEIEIQLLADGNPVGSTVKLEETNNWEYSFTNLPKYKNGIEIKYTIKEVNVPAGYENSVINYSNNGFVVIVNKVTPKIDIEGEKTWDDHNNQDGKRPSSIEINLYKTVNDITEAVKDENGNDVKITVSPDINGDWKYKFKDLPKYENGVEIKYSVKEKIVIGYVPEYSDNNINIVNKYEPLKTAFHVTKSWDDNNNSEGIRPKEIEIQLLADGNPVGSTVKLEETNNWEYSFTNLPKYKNGIEIKYTIKEVNVPAGYENSVINYSNNGFVVIVNKVTPKIDIEGEKTWDDHNNQDGKRPSSIEINLYKTVNDITEAVKDENGNDVKITVSPDINGDWKYKFKDLPKYDNGVEIKYSVKEKIVIGYIPEYSENNINIVNKYEPLKTAFHVTKSWDDNNNSEGIRPKEIEIQLLADGNPVGSTVKLEETNNWEYSFTNLPKYKNGIEIKYTIKEVNVPAGYENSVINYSNNGFVVIVNKVTPKIDIEGEKTWDDHNNQDGKRPTEITVYLLQNGNRVHDNWRTYTKRVTPDANGNWIYEWKNLPKYDKNGNKYIYTVIEKEIEGYTPEYFLSGNTPGKEFNINILNKYTPEKTSVTVLKVWDDDSDKDGIRPSEIKIELYKTVDNKKELVDTITLNKSNSWRYTWSDLDKYEDGKLIKYTVKEKDVPKGYASEQTDDGTIITITNTHKPTNPVDPPTEETPPTTKPSKPTEETPPTTKPGKETESTKNTKPTDPTKPNKELPKTGIIGTIGISIAGVGLALGGMHQLRNKKKDDK